MFTYYKSIAANDISLGYSSMLLKGLTQLVICRSNFYITNEYLRRIPTATFTTS